MYSCGHIWLNSWLYKLKPQILYTPGFYYPFSSSDMRRRRFSHLSMSLSFKNPLTCQHIVGQTVAFPLDVVQSDILYLLGSFDATPLRATPVMLLTSRCRDSLIVNALVCGSTSAVCTKACLWAGVVCRGGLFCGKLPYQSMFSVLANNCKYRVHSVHHGYWWKMPYKQNTG